MTWQKMFCVFSVFTFTLAPYAWAQTIVGGFINSDTHWMAGNGPFIVGQSILVTNNATLTIDPGVEVRFNPDLGMIIDSGQLIARGTEANKIKFTANVAGATVIPENLRWGFISFADGSVDATFDTNDDYISGSIIEHAIVEGAGSVSGSQGAIQAISASPFIHRSLIHNNTGIGIFGDQADGIRITESTINLNSSSGILVENTDGFTFSKNTVTNNRFSGINVDNGGISKFNALGRLLISENTLIENAGDGINSRNTTGLEIDRNTIHDNRGSGLFLQGPQGDTRISDNTISENRGDGVRILTLRENDSITFDHDRIINNDNDGVNVSSARSQIVLSLDQDNPTEISGNEGFKIFNNSEFTGADLHDAGNIDARNVLWGTTNFSQIEDGIFDFFDILNRGIVFFDPIAVPEPGAAAMLALLGAAVLRRRLV